MGLFTESQRDFIRAQIEGERQHHRVVIGAYLKGVLDRLAKRPACGCLLQFRWLWAAPEIDQIFPTEGEVRVKEACRKRDCDGPSEAAALKDLMSEVLRQTRADTSNDAAAFAAEWEDRGTYEGRRR